MEFMGFDTEEAQKSSAKLAKGLNQFEEKLGKTKNAKESIAVHRQAVHYIEGFPVPSDKEDLIDFIIAMDERRKANTWAIYKSGYKTKWKEAMKKAILLFPDDPHVIAVTAELRKKTITEKIFERILDFFKHK